MGQRHILNEAISGLQIVWHLTGLREAASSLTGAAVLTLTKMVPLILWILRCLTAAALKSLPIE